MTKARIFGGERVQRALATTVQRLPSNPSSYSLRWLLHGVIVFGLVATFGYRVNQQMHSGPPGSDAVAYMTMAYNLVNHGIISLDHPPDELQPSSYRAPGYPAFAAIALAATREARDMEVTEFLNKSLLGLKITQSILIILVTAILASGAVWYLTRNWLSAYVTFFGVACTGSLHRASASLLAEPLAALLITMLALSLYAAIRTRKLYFFAIAGVVIGALALTRTAFFYMWPVVLLYFLYVRVVTTDKRALVSGALIFMALFAVIAGSWMARNDHHFGKAYITERGGIALIHRAEFNMMTVSEYFGSFCYYSNCQPLQYLLKFFDPEDYRRLDQYHDNSYYKAARARREQALRQYDTSLEADNALRAEGIRLLFIEHPLRNIAVTLPMAHRGMYFQRCSLTIIVFASTFYLLWVSVRKRDVETLSLFTPFIFNFAFTSFVTMSIPRFNIPLLPLLWVATGLVLARILSNTAVRYYGYYSNGSRGARKQVGRGGPEKSDSGISGFEA